MLTWQEDEVGAHAAFTTDRAYLIQVQILEDGSPNYYAMWHSPAEGVEWTDLTEGPDLAAVKQYCSTHNRMRRAQRK